MSIYMNIREFFGRCMATSPISEANLFLFAILRPLSVDATRVHVPNTSQYIPMHPNAFIPHFSTFLHIFLLSSPSVPGRSTTSWRFRWWISGPRATWRRRRRPGSRRRVPMWMRCKACVCLEAIGWRWDMIDGTFYDWWDGDGIGVTCNMM